MRFFEDMRSKYGFSDGEASPNGVELYRQVYVQALNRLAAALGSGVRTYAYDRPGSHNWCMLLFAPAGETAVYSEMELAYGKPGDDLAHLSSVIPDELMEEAIVLAHDADLDFCVGTTVSICSDELALVLNELDDTAAAVLADMKLEEETC